MPSQSPPNLGVPSANYPFLNPNGTISQPWYRYMVALNNATSGSISPSSVTVDGIFTAEGEVIFSDQVDGASTHLGTLTNAPHIGDPDFWVQLTVNGVKGYVPWWKA